ncbi:DUF3050 domain-containing protein [Salibacter sp.]|uniref:DUF3050 domain-containing protein n=1 Tax=Salibacter sp. TaxID=2010995 RepID=UPI00286FE796|nr:DUF3050 domain-containing protein [Salibacter sp.]MDR9399501.1 DUF3050 domain-containing protein [Salibacter sp.]MDR9488561.1 DUF3050 domain-containing protein [Salibacter sp.]
MKSEIEELKESIEPLKNQIINHKVYSAIESIDDLKIFMQYHIYAVWDFMSLLKTLQNNLTCTNVPWFPNGSANTRFLINEIVVGEEADIDEKGNRKSHFELYLDAMHQIGADTSSIEMFTDALKFDGDFENAYSKSNIPKEAREFIDFTFEVIETNKDYLQAAIFTFGREDLIPDMFHAIVNDLYQESPDKISVFKYYLERHIEIDGDHHSELALQMTANLCGSNEEYWEEALKFTVECLQKRIQLWNGIYEKIKAKK